MISLRAEIRDALDDVIPPDPMLEREVTAYVMAEKRDGISLARRPRRSPWTYRFQGTAAVLAAALIVVLLAGLILGGRLLRDRNNAPSPAINQTELKKLEARPLIAMPAMPPDGLCPTGPLGTDFYGRLAVGNGAVRSVIGWTVYTGDWGTWNPTWFLASPTDKRLFIVRGRDLQSGATVFFSGNVSGVADANMGTAIPMGKVAGRDHVNGQTVQLRPELVIDAHSAGDFPNSNKAKAFGAYVGVSKAGSGCVFFQVDYDHSTESFVRSY